MSKALAETPSKSDADSTPIPPRERILTVARELFYRHGVHAVGVELIAEAAQTNKMTLYRHFKSKDELVVAYARGLAEDGDALWKRLATTFPDDPGKRLNAWVDHVEEILTSSAERGCALANAAVELQADHPARTVIEDYKRRKRSHLVELFRDSRYHNPELLADEVFLLFEGARISIQCGGREPALRVVEMLRDLLARAPRDAT
ncbi:TetR/AcrR family transcriptional regulator [Hyphomicrobium sp. CS1GBMeth3]|uniref:TetR/AcrR family transcriptional regulator n=1 Tax=Hyphomicrobium sp. CS1GBMeth3 TaxID=1892845 RepID=UPI000931C66E|nr:TetR/AcrR family transcriptional regulator [Hyphomicrobium sp. CS1GBMeth3]